MPRVLEEVPRRERTTVCPGCGHTIAYVANDIQERTASDYTGCSDTTYYIHCPSKGCSKQIPVPLYERKGWTL